METARVLIIDDSVVIRRMLSNILESDPAVEVVGVAANASIGIRKIAEVNPTIVTLDIEMPDMNGLDAVVEIRKLYPHLPVVMFSSLAVEACSITLDALSRGATDCATKPSGWKTREEAEEHLREGLLEKVKLLGRPRVRDTKPPAPVRARPAPTAARGPIELLVIGASTCGPRALADLFSAFQRELPVPVCIVQHMPPMFTRLLAERLNAISPMRIVEAESGMALAPGRVFVAPGDFHLSLERKDGEVKTVLEKGPPENSCRPAVDVLFRSAAGLYGSAALGVVLTGMGADGLKGAERLVEKHAPIIVQDEETSVVWGMPGFIARAGLANEILPLSSIASHIEARLRLNAARGRATTGRTEDATWPA